MDKLNVDDLELGDKRVFVRVDFNVPLDDTGAVTDDSRIRAALPTINHILSEKGRVILASHLGRPKGSVVPHLRMDPVAEGLGALLNRKTIKVDDCIGEQAEEAARSLDPGEVLILENLRFHPEEEQNDPDFSRALASLADLYVNDAFGTAHRAHASTVGITSFLPRAAAGFLMAKEIRFFSKILESPEKPFVVILGGAKVSDKIGVIENLMRLADTLLIGGGMAYTFLKARGQEIGDSLLEEDKIDEARRILETADQRGLKVCLPVDHVVAEGSPGDTPARIIEAEHGIPAGCRGADIGPRTVKAFCEEVETAATVLWNGPMGIFEEDAFSEGTRQLAQCISKLHATTVAGGGDTAAAIAQFGLMDHMSHVSTGGGASLEILENKVLPGIQALTDKPGA